MKNNFTSKRILCFCVSFLLILGFSSFLPVFGESEIYDSVIRLHILANSDSEYDQSVKLQIRDAIIGEEERFFNAATKEEAERQLEEKLPEIVDFVNSKLAEYDVDYRANAKIDTEIYPTREYDGVAYPAGEYKSLRIFLGEGSGQNWWCVLFPPLCTGASTAEDSLDIPCEAKKTFINNGEIKYKFRFKLLELFGFGK